METKDYIGISAVVVSIFLTWQAASWKHEGEITSLKLEYSNAIIKANEEANTITETLQNAIKLTDESHTKDLEKKENEINSLRSSIASGAIKLHTAGKCPSTDKTTAPSTSVGNGGSPELGAEDGQTYLSLKSDINKIVEQLLTAQDILRSERKENDDVGTK